MVNNFKSLTLHLSFPKHFENYYVVRSNSNFQIQKRILFMETAVSNCRCVQNRYFGITLGFLDFLNIHDIIGGIRWLSDWPLKAGLYILAFKGLCVYVYSIQHIDDRSNKGHCCQFSYDLYCFPLWYYHNSSTLG